uniref:Uncharacterized protein n=1 Tax=Romanomermis culicivorax TaxID=13658 RepID=A0A915KDX6_ROMCU
MGVPLKLFLNRANCSPSTYRSMLSYFYRQIADGKSSNLGQFRSRCQPPPTTTTQNSTPTVRPTFPSANATT